MSVVLKLGVAGGFLLGWGLVLARVAQGDSSQTNLEWFGHLTAVLALGVFTAGLIALGVSLKGLVVGQDNRVSTSKLQPLMWTYVIAAALLSLVIAKFADAEAGYEALLDEGLKDEYLILLGGPFAAAVLAKGIVSAKTESGDLTKTEGTPELSQVVSDDAGNADLVDTQYLIFNLVALVYFVGAFVTEANDGLPEIPELLVGLTGVAAATYVSNKAVLKNPPTLIRIVPPTAAVGQTVTIYGRWLLVSRLTEQNELEDVPPQVLFDETPATVGTITRNVGGAEQVVVTVPDVPGRSGATSVNVRAINAVGTEGNPLVFTIPA